MGSFIVSGLGRQSLETLKKEGLCYQAEVVSIIPSLWIRVGSYVTVRLECVAKTETGDMRFRSGYFLISPFDKKEDLLATIYIDTLNFKRYSIELFRAQED
ncbi:hypothetical protein DWB64_09815 [Fusibacter sp. A1]|nr:hypothetical protein DWB64_09815 [Fusibacter sp. A1]